MALVEEHRQRTSHDVFRQNRFKPPWIRCNVCLYLDKMKREFENEEANYYKSQEEKGKEEVKDVSK
jgi:hypothetical protein